MTDTQENKTPIRVLIVEDDVPTRIGLRAIFSSEPDMLVVGESADGDDAVRQSDLLAPDVVLMDIQLGERDGIAATGRITSRPRPDGSTPRVIVLTTFEIDEYAYRSLEAGASGFLLKRTRAEEIVRAVRVVADGSELPVPVLARRLIERYARARSEPVRHIDLNALTDRESQVLVLIARGMSNSEIATSLGISLDTVKSHIKHVFLKLHVRDRAQAVIAAYEGGLIEPSLGN
jgi:DNA-binding NarL/FixJ family response regulator